MTDQAILSAKGLTKRFGALTVVEDVSFDVGRGEVLGILGPNGAGKTTLFNLISGDLAANGGELSLDGSPLRAEPPFKRCKRGIGRTYQVPQPFGAMTAFENLLVPAMMSARMSEAEANDHCAEVLRDCGLLPYANTAAGSLRLALGLGVRVDEELVHGGGQPIRLGLGLGLGLGVGVGVGIGLGLGLRLR